MTYNFIPDVLTQDLSQVQAELLDHPLWRDVVEGTATTAQLRAFALQDHWLVRHSLQLETLLIAHAPNEHARTVLARKLEPKAVFAGEGSLVHFGAAVGLSPEDFEAVEPLPGCAALTAHFYYALARDGFLGMLASIAASESVFIAICDLAGPALRERYGFTDEQVAFFPLHDGLKEGVNVGETDLLRELASTSEARELVTRTVRRTYGLERLFYDTVYAAR
ncbi:iron-containing redox enzyme family protein [Deinococcus metallilatus]|uniref:Thiaminase/transcriptional activator TenA n=1 Tax=Deinococcus metallilatus TaxID=1211322 RepID=A0ABR6MUY8_9DEIO|nr:iron-containing redox enzyme family protein [Deinococcus metallilatus]MBB5295731.1 thiaminase/transcriptional activator TenA [Deinococcus metallilatus]GMA14261.1 hypothetical protein GCM10025871_05920 [Deinococcus metallilatus]